MPEGWSGMGMFGLRPLNVNRLVVKKGEYSGQREDVICQVTSWV